MSTKINCLNVEITSCLKKQEHGSKMKDNVKKGTLRQDLMASSVSIISCSTSSQAIFFFLWAITASCHTEIHVDN